MLQLHELRKIYPGNKVALDGVSLEIGFGVFGLLGPNGAGKSSLMEILSGGLAFEGGSVRFGTALDIRKNPSGWQRILGYLPQDVDFPSHTTGREILTEGALLLGLGGRAIQQRINKLLEQANLVEAADREAARYSRGMKQRLGFILALLHEPSLLLLDEPTAGLDPVERVFFRDLLASVSQERVVLLSTHIVGDVERCCERLAVLEKGSIRFSGTPSALSALAHGRTWEFPVEPRQIDALVADRRVVSITDRDGVPWLRMVADEAPQPNATHCDASLEDGYMQLLGGVRAEATPLSAHK